MKENGNLEEAASTCQKIIDEVSSVFVGNRQLLKKLLSAGVANGHVLLEDYPGVGKTLLVKALARTVGCNYTRIQFTPDLLPADIIGTRVWKQKEGEFELMRGPIFTNILLADEINRTPPKTQAALLEAMAERQVTIEGVRHSLESPFFALATQNPIDQEGTYPLPEAQMDRFLLKLSVGYAASLEEESSILSRRIDWKKEDPVEDMQVVTSVEEFVTLQQLAETGIYVDQCILDYVSQIVRATREHPKAEVGSSPRGALALLKLARSMAVINGRDFVTPDDIKLFASETLSHRIILHIEYALDDVKGQDIVDEVMRGIPVPVDYMPRKS
jgi:MoxR-like ATPase